MLQSRQLSDNVLSIFCCVLAISFPTLFHSPKISFATQPIHSTAASQPDPSSSHLATVEDWNQWRGPSRTGIVNSSPWPSKLDSSNFSQLWRTQLEPSYSGPLVVGDVVFTTETKNKKYEVVSAIDRTSGNQLWSHEWEGSMQVPFFARANGDWIRATPAFDEGKLFVGGMRDVLLCLDANLGNELWRLDFPRTLKSTLPTFGFVSSPLIHEDSVYVQAGGGFCRIRKATGEIVWKSLEDGGGMNGSAFSSPVIATLAGITQAVVQTRTKLCGVDLETGKVLWSKEIPTFRGMNILTPTVVGDQIFVSSYGGTTQVLELKVTDGVFQLSQIWNVPSQGYMNSPVVIEGYVYIHLKNQRLACYELATGKEAWKSKPFGKYISMVANGDKILALDERGDLLLFRATPEKFDLLSSVKVGDDSWAHLAVRGDQVFIRNLKELIAFNWN